MNSFVKITKRPVVYQAFIKQRNLMPTVTVTLSFLHNKGFLFGPGGG